MEKERFTFEVDREKMFDTIATQGDGGQAIALRIAGVLLQGKPDWRDAVGLDFYGLTFIPTSEGGGGVSCQRKEVIGNATLYLGDCREVLPTLQPVDAVVTDWPYGIGEAAGANRSRSNLAQAADYGDDDWDNQPISPDLVDLVRSAGRWNILFGGNYYSLPATSCWLVWDKENGANDFADCELAWTNLPKAVRRIKWAWNGFIRKGEMSRKPGQWDRRNHPTEKPVGVMEWAIGHLPQNAAIIIDPFMGSGTTGVACHNLQRAFVGVERNERYFDIACRRIEDAQRQGNLFSEQAA